MKRYPYEIRAQAAALHGRLSSMVEDFDTSLAQNEIILRNWGWTGGQLYALEQQGVDISIPSRALKGAWRAILLRRWREALGYLNAIRSWCGTIY